MSLEESTAEDSTSDTEDTAQPEEETPEEELPEEDVPEEETPDAEEEESLDLEFPDHWSEGYLKYLLEQDNIVETAVVVPSFMEILTAVFTTPDAPVSRGSALEFLMGIANYKLETITLNTRSLAFADVKIDDELAPFIQFAYENHLVNGYPNGTFQPDRTINRAEALKLCATFFQKDWNGTEFGAELLATFELSENPFADVDLEAWYAPYLMNAYTAGIVQGYGDGNFGPGNPVTYAEFLKIATLMENLSQTGVSDGI